ncbi:hypothetical protein AB0K11_20350 [Mycobacterium sp. NPDC050551]|uniref:hypothetical protein n=1 Tax=Mycobacterium sp. NPDC050551 TaxID=3155407 RepID=UPI003445D706
MNGHLRTAVVLLVLGASVACGRLTDGHPATPVTAFPDLAHYPEVDWTPYRAEDTRRYFSGSAFATPGGQLCSKNTRDYAHRLWCHGPRPDIDGYWDLSFGPDDAATAKQADPPAGADAGPSTLPVLPPGHRIALSDGMECAVSEDAMFACRAGEHGFVLTRAGSRLF